MGRARGMVTGVAIGLVMAAAAGIAFVWSGGLQLSNPFSTETRSRDQSALLVELRDVSRYQAASGQFQVLVDLEDDVRFLPSWLSGNRTTFVAEGDVDAVVDFTDLSNGAITTSDDGSRATITLPEPTLSAPRIDPDQSRVLSEDKGLVDRVDDAMSGTSDHDQDLYQAADRKLARAATQSDLVDRAKANTTEMLTNLLEGLGYDEVGVTFEGPASSTAA